MTEQDQAERPEPAGGRAPLRRLFALPVAGAAIGLVAGGLAWSVLPKGHVATATIALDARPGAKAPPDLDPRLVLANGVLARIVREENLTDAVGNGSAPSTLSGLTSLLGFGARGQARSDIASSSLASRIQVKPRPELNGLSIAVRAETADDAARLANAVARVALAERTEGQLDEARQLRQREMIRLQMLQTKVLEAEAKVAAARSAAGLAADPRSELMQARQSAQEARQRVELIQRLIASPRDGEGIDLAKIPGLERMRSQLAEAIRQETGFRQTLGPRHPQMIEAQQRLRDARKAFTDELKRSLEAAKAEVAAQEAAEQAVARRMDGTAGSADSGQARLRTLETEAEGHRAAYERALRNRSGDDDGAEAPIGRLIAPAQASEATLTPNRAACLGVGGALGLFAGAFLAAIGDLGRRRRARVEAVDEPPRPMFSAPAAAKPGPPVRREPRFVPVNAEAAPPDPAPDLPEPGFERPRWTPIHAHSDAGAKPASRVQDTRDDGQDWEAQLAQTADTLLAGRSRRGPLTVLVTAPTSSRVAAASALALARVAASRSARVLLIDADRINGLLTNELAESGPSGRIDVAGRARRVVSLSDSWEDGLFFVPTEKAGPPPRRGHAFDGIAEHFDLVVMAGPAPARRPELNRLAAGADRVVVATSTGTQGVLPHMARQLGRSLDSLMMLRRAA